MAGLFLSRTIYKGLFAPANERSKLRSKTFLGIAKAMASQWSELI
jgi:hypothetical protein